MSEIKTEEIHSYLLELSARMTSIGSEEDAAMLLTAANRLMDAAHFASGLAAVAKLVDMVIASSPAAREDDEVEVTP